MPARLLGGALRVCIGGRQEARVGLIVERIRKNGMTDTHRWYCDQCNNVLFEKTVGIEILERDMPPVFEAYYGNPDHQTCKKCGHRNPGHPKAG